MPAVAHSPSPVFSEEQKRQRRRKLERQRTWTWIPDAAFFVYVATLGIWRLPGADWIRAVLVVVGALTYWVARHRLRCPDCDGLLGRHIPAWCPNCGVAVSRQARVGGNARLGMPGTPVAPGRSNTAFDAGQAKEWRREYARQGKTRWKLNIPVLVVLGFALAARWNGSEDALARLRYLWIPLLLGLGAILAVYLKTSHRCPSCGARIPEAAGDRYCSHCGIPLRD